jgi:hypothetical protein
VHTHDEQAEHQAADSGFQGVNPTVKWRYIWSRWFAHHLTTNWSQTAVYLPSDPNKSNSTCVYLGVAEDLVAGSRTHSTPLISDH